MGPVRTVSAKGALGMSNLTPHCIGQKGRSEQTPFKKEEGESVVGVVEVKFEDDTTLDAVFPDN